MSQDRTFSSFESMSKSKWKELATKDLKGASFNEKLIWETPGGLTLDPYYNEEVRPAVSYLQGYQNQLQTESDWVPAPRRWVNLALVVVTDAETGNQAALEALNHGASGIEFQITQDFNPSNLKTLLEGISLPHITVGFSLPEGELGCAEKLLKYFTQQGYDSNEINGYIHCESIPDQLEVLSTLHSLPGYKALVLESVSGTPLVLSIGNFLASAVQIIDVLIDQKYNLEGLFSQVLFRVHLGRDYFREMARLRVLRMLWHQIVFHYGLLDYKPSDVQIQAVTSVNTRDPKNVHDNMLSNTGQAMAAILGGCNLLSVTPHDQGLQKPNAFSRRMALNITNLLIEEGHFDKVADPVAGTYFMETLVDKMAEKAWEVFQSELST
ncbi:MAG: methylmalonyl-CoA mutase family protein [Cyclobacteriaceae bacterium]